MISDGQGAVIRAEQAPVAHASDDTPIRVMIVDDSAVVCGLVSRWLEEEPGLEVVARHANGRLAVDDVRRSAPDVVLLDIEMPVMDGMEALPLLLDARPEVQVLVISTVTKRNAEISFKALARGALDYVPKPETNREITTLPDFRDEVIRKVRALARAHRPGFPLAAAARPPAAFKQRAAGADQLARSAVSCARPHARADCPAHAADIHNDPSRTPDAGGPARDQGSGRWRAASARHDLCRTGQLPHDGTWFGGSAVGRRRWAAS